MPTYGYQCTECKHEFSVFQAMKDSPLSNCPQCDGTVKRLLYPVGVIFKGSGWYINDSRKPEAGADNSTGEAKPATGDVKSTDTPATAAGSAIGDVSKEPSRDTKPASETH